MDKAALAKTIRNRAATIIDSPPHDGPEHQERMDDAELLCVLSRVLNGRPVEQAFGAPGDWGYNTPIGKALAAKGPLTCSRCGRHSYGGEANGATCAMTQPDGTKCSGTLER